MGREHWFLISFLHQSPEPSQCDRSLETVPLLVLTDLVSEPRSLSLGSQAMLLNHNHDGCSQAPNTYYSLGTVLGALPWVSLQAL